MITQKTSRKRYNDFEMDQENCTSTLNTNNEATQFVVYLLFIHAAQKDIHKKKSVQRQNYAPRYPQC